MEKKGINFEVKSFYSYTDLELLYGSGLFRKIRILSTGILRRWRHIFKAGNYNWVFVHREIAPIGPPLFEWLISKILRRKIIYDFDDAIWTTDNKNENGIVKLMRCRWKIASVCRWSHKVSAGNDYLAAYARHHNKNVHIIPTTVDVQFSHNKVKTHTNEPVPVIGWTGSHSTLEYLKPLIPIIKNLEATMEFRFIVIADQNPEFDLHTFEFIIWNKDSEVEDLLKIDIGIMPLPDDEWTKGKCGLKLLQFMALGIPVIASPIGVNTSIVRHGDNGYLASTDREWTNYLRLQLNDPGKRQQFGHYGRLVVEKNYSVEANSDFFMELFA